MSAENEQVKTLIADIKKTLGFSIEAISQKANIKYSRLTNILYNRTEANQKDIEAIKSVLNPPISKNYKTELEALVAENETLKQQLWESLKDKEFQQGTIDKLLKIIEEYSKKDKP